MPRPAGASKPGKQTMLMQALARTASAPNRQDQRTAGMIGYLRSLVLAPPLQHERGHAIFLDRRSGWLGDTPEENEAIADWLSSSFNMDSIRLEINKDWGIVETQSEKHQNWGYRFYPNRLKGEGFFLACFKKREGGIPSTLKTKKQEPIRIPANHLQSIAQWIKPGSDIHIIPFQDGYMAIPVGQEHDLAILQERLYLKKSGTRLGKFANKDFIPDHELALSLLAAETIPRIELNRDQAISYLKKQDIQLNTDLSGWALVCYEGHALGWAKVLPNRINNYYP